MTTVPTKPQLEDETWPPVTEIGQLSRDLDAVCRVVDIADELSITVGGVSKLVDRVERAGWCVRAPNPNDARSSVLTFTRTGRRVLEAAYDSCNDEPAARLGAALSSERLASFASTVRDLRRHIADQPRSPR